MNEININYILEIYINNINIKSTETINDTGWGTTCSLRRFLNKTRNLID